MDFRAATTLIRGTLIIIPTGTLDTHTSTTIRMPGIGIHIIPLPQPTEDIGLPTVSIGTIITIASNLTEDSEIRALIGKELHISSKFFSFSLWSGTARPLASELY